MSGDTQQMNRILEFLDIDSERQLVMMEGFLSLFTLPFKADFSIEELRELNDSVANCFTRLMYFRARELSPSKLARFLAISSFSMLSFRFLLVTACSLPHNSQMFISAHFLYLLPELFYMSLLSMDSFTTR